MELLRLRNLMDSNIPGELDAVARYREILDGEERSRRAALRERGLADPADVNAEAQGAGATTIDIDVTATSALGGALGPTTVAAGGAAGGAAAAAAAGGGTGGLSGGSEEAAAQAAAARAATTRAAEDDPFSGLSRKEAAMAEAKAAKAAAPAEGAVAEGAEGAADAAEGATEAQGEEAAGPSGLRGWIPERNRMAGEHVSGYTWGECEDEMEVST